ncbi:hypothetical protein PENARI_c005G04891 [Penicillium arizonense]|uniref:Zn(2)-C6 fungal-type domain-containing protein n=1 Tax=Penicillium arizonense TaxID=1835702 RepID=A0A1F5LQI7_PENAI|nr:hypothetical protein PENARI_c005G04891 [Penicillium arizonense]OGE55141.1 hypothetical protein PENARI_c005G04891 [Penicillium arizonense]
MSEDDSSHSRERGPAPKRGRVSCQKRKVKCSGENNCEQCQTNDLVCTYAQGRKRRRATGAPRQTIPEPSSELPRAVPDTELTKSLAQMMNRISDLEQNCQSLKTQLAAPHASDLNPTPQSTSRQSSLSSRLNEPVIPVDESFRGPTNMLEPIRILSKTVAKWDQMQELPGYEVPPEHCAANNWDWHDSTTERICGIDILNREAHIDDIGQLQSTVDIYFSQINPMFPCLNENQFRAQLHDALENGASSMDRPNRYQFFALVHLIQAEVLILTQDWKPSDTIPGWKSILRAENILSRLLWQGNGNLLTIQCLVVKSRYFLYLERGGAAHETITRAVRLCFQLGLHDSSSWEQCSAFEKVMRQRVFWSVFQLERSLALNNGYPYLIRESEISVDLPPCHNDQELFPDGPIQNEAHSSGKSYGPLVVMAAKWGGLVSDIWDAMFAARARKPMTLEYIAGMDARVAHVMKNLPFYMKPPAPDPKSQSVDNQAPFSPPHVGIIQLRFNQLRLLLHQSSLLSFEYDHEVAATCLSIIRDVLRIIQSLLDSPNRASSRFIAVFHIVVTQIPLVCLIMHPKNSLETRAGAASCFKTELSILHDLAPTFAMARHVLRRLRALITSVKATMQEIAPASVGHTDATESIEVPPHQPMVTSHLTYNVPIDLDSTTLDQILGDSLFTDTDPAFHHNDLTSLWPDDLMSFPWAIPAGTVL